MSDDDAEVSERTKASKSSESSETSTEQQRPRKKPSSAESAKKRSTSSSSTSSAGTSTSQSSTSATSAGRRSEGREPARQKRSSQLSAVSASKKAIEQYRSLTGRSPESVVGVKKSDDGWNVKLEVVEARRVPDTADLLAEYDVNLDTSGELLSYDRSGRYIRGRPSV